jgi:hypothetical protein
MLKKIGMGLLLVPLGFFLLFAFGEVFSGDLSGLSHLVPAALIALVIFLASKRPRIAGILLLVVGIVFGVGYALDGSSNFRTIFLVESFLFLPPFVSGILLILSSREKYLKR